jgi:hypothetical protein
VVSFFFFFWLGFVFGSWENLEKKCALFPVEQDESLLLFT